MFTLDTRYPDASIRRIGRRLRIILEYRIPLIRHIGPHQYTVLENQLLSVSLLICLGKRDCVERISSVGGNLRVLSAEEAWETIKDCAQCDKHWKNPTSTIPDQTIANLKTQLVENEVVRVMIPKCMPWLDDELIRDLNTIEDKVDNPSPQSTSQVLSSFEVYTQPMTNPEDVEETIGTPIEVEPLNETKLEEVGLNGNHNTPLSSREVTSFDGPKP
ncbi:hypothetical protein Tco_0969354 [Tanacetum coccineum]